MFYVLAILAILAISGVILGIIFLASFIKMKDKTLIIIVAIIIIWGVMIFVGAEYYMAALWFFGISMLICLGIKIQWIFNKNSQKKKVDYVFLGIFVGALGIHNFYAGYKNKAIAQLLITLLSFGLLGIVINIWAIIEICTITKDADGIPFE